MENHVGDYKDCSLNSYVVYPLIMENQMEKIMDNEMETEIILGGYRGS